MITRRILFIGGPKLDGFFCRRLEQRGFSVSAGDDLEKAAELLTSARIDLVIVNLDEKADAVGLIMRIRKMPALAATSVLAVGTWGTGQPTVALTAGADAYEPLPIEPGRLVDAIERILHKRAAVVGMSE